MIEALKYNNTSKNVGKQKIGGIRKRDIINSILESNIKISLSSDLSDIIKYMPVWYHQLIVAEYAKSIAVMLRCRDSVTKKVYIAGLFHDISKVLWDIRLHLQPYKFLSDEEKEKIRMHPKESVEILHKYAPPKHRRFLSLGSVSIMDIIMYHHEKPDGTGYYGLKGMPKESIILSIADIFDACTENRPYRIAPLSVEESISVSLKPFKSALSDEEIVVIKRALAWIIQEKNSYHEFFNVEFNLDV